MLVNPGIRYLPAQRIKWKAYLGHPLQYYENHLAMSFEGLVMQAVAKLDVYQTGELTVVGFSDRDLHDQLNLADCHDEIQGFIREHSCRALAIDLTRIQSIPSDFLGLLSFVHRMGIELHLFNPPLDLRESLEVTHFKSFLHVHEIDV